MQFDQDSLERLKGAQERQKERNLSWRHLIAMTLVWVRGGRVRRCQKHAERGWEHGFCFSGDLEKAGKELFLKPVLTNTTLQDVADGDWQMSTHGDGDGHLHLNIACICFARIGLARCFRRLSLPEWILPLALQV